MKSIGLAGDVVVSIAAAYVTAGVSAGAQVAGKAAGATSQWLNRLRRKLVNKLQKK